MGVEAVLQQAAARPTFAPAISRRSVQLVEDSVQLPGNFMQRQDLFRQRQEQRLLKLANKAVGPPPLLLPAH